MGLKCFPTCSWRAEEIALTSLSVTTLLRLITAMLGIWVPSLAVAVEAKSWAAESGRGRWRGALCRSKPPDEGACCRGPLSDHEIVRDGAGKRYGHGQSGDRR